MSKKKFEVFCEKCGNVSIPEFPEELLEISTFGTCKVPFITDPEIISQANSFNMVMMHRKPRIIVELPTCNGKMRLRDASTVLKKID